jgi:hypothetical protein
VAFETIGESLHHSETLIKQKMNRRRSTIVKRIRMKLNYSFRDFVEQFTYFYQQMKNVSEEKVLTQSLPVTITNLLFLQYFSSSLRVMLIPLVLEMKIISGEDEEKKS